MASEKPCAGPGFRPDWSHVTGTYPSREFTMQHNESDADFLRRLWKRRGIAWFIQPGQASRPQSQDMPAHVLVLFDDAFALSQNVAGTVRYHRDDGSEQSDTIVAWSPVRKLTPGSINRLSWNYLQGSPLTANAPSSIDQGTTGNRFSASLDEYLIDIPHAGTDGNDYRDLGELRMKRHEYESKCFHGEGSARTVSEPGDQTVPARSADDQLLSGAFAGMFRQTGYEHQSSYKDPRAIASTLYSIVRIAQKASWKC